MRRRGSLVIDGAASERAARAWARHVRGCADCMDWQHRAERLRRELRMSVAEQQTASTTTPGSAGTGRAARRHLLRLGLAALAAAQLLSALLPLLTGNHHDGHESGAADIAVAVGVLVVAWRPSRAAGLSPVLGCFALLLVATAVADVLRGEVLAAQEVPHLIVLAEAALLTALRRIPPVPSSGEPARAARTQAAA